MKIQAVIFDLDGVLCFTDEYHYRAWKELADERGIPFDRQINNRLRGVSRMDSLEIILEKSPVKYTAEEKFRMAEEKNRRYQELLAEMTPADLPPGVRETLEELRGRGLKLAVGSSSKNAKFILERVGLSDFFDAVSDGTNITRSKPDPEVFLKAAEMLALPPACCLVVEDAAAGIQAAATGGFRSAGLGEAAESPLVTWPIRSLEELLSLI